MDIEAILSYRGEHKKHDFTVNVTVQESVCGSGLEGKTRSLTLHVQWAEKKCEQD